MSGIGSMYQKYRVFGMLGFMAVASAAIIPLQNGLRQQNTNPDVSENGLGLNGEGYTYQANGLTENLQSSVEGSGFEELPKADATNVGNDGYEYQIVRRLRYRQRRDVSEIANEYLPPSEEAPMETVSEAIVEEEPQKSAALGSDGYEYKTVRRLKYRQRRDVSEIANEYLPPSEEALVEPVAEVMTEEEPKESAMLGSDGYEYKTVRRLKYRQRRDVSEIANEYLPPTEEAPVESVSQVKTEEEPQESAMLGSDGYEYKTLLRLKYRQRRDVSEIANEYLPPSEEAPMETVSEAIVEEEPQKSAALGSDGYEYKTVRRLKYRQRRDVSEIANEYLPPSEEAPVEPVDEVMTEEEPKESAMLGSDGYEYKTVRRLKYRQRRDVSEIGNEYLPPSEEAPVEPVDEVMTEEEPKESAMLGSDGYEYKTVRRLKYRQRRDVSEIANEYLPPSEEAPVEPIDEVTTEEEPKESAMLGSDGYEYKTVRRLKYRQRRDVSEIANEYLPPSEEAPVEPVDEVMTEEEPKESAMLGSDGYEYKTVRRLKYRQRRDVSEIANEYLPPSEEAPVEPIDEVTTEEEPKESAMLGSDGYEYKTVRRLKYRQRRDVSEIANEYLPPSEKAPVEPVDEVMTEEEPKESAMLGSDGYEYKTVRRLKYRQRRDVSEIANEYLPPSEEASVEPVSDVKTEEKPQESAALGSDGYEYKTVRRLKYRQRRDVSSEIANEYLPPSEEASVEPVAEVMTEEEPEESAILGSDGYAYKTVRRLKYRQRRDVSEIANEYLAPSEEATVEPLAEVMTEEEPKESAALGSDGYEYKTVRRLKYRQRRDVSEIANEYLPPSEEAPVEPLAEVMKEEEPQESAALGSDGYEYKTVRRLKYRQRRDVSEIINEYIPPSQENVSKPVAVVMTEEEPQESAALGSDGYEYKTVRRLKYRQRRDVSEIANDYLPPSVEAPVEPVSDIKTEEEPQESATLGSDGYEYKTVRRLKYRQRRDVSEILNEYIPPSQENVPSVAKEYFSPSEEVPVESVPEVMIEEEPQEYAALGSDGYEYKTVRRLKYRQRRDVSEIANEYLAPAVETPVATVSEVKSVEEPQESTMLGSDGYEYKTIRRLKYRQRRDVSEIANEYLPPTENEGKPTNEYVPPSSESIFQSQELSADTAILDKDGYKYKTVRRLKF
ncbi:fibrous sheath CABYR-binding protein-like [Stomoxys calcitrans]|uniref:fibrous sheath CABYR-binding protein-like n=1 Tax=Stomoxys calcitrans TaxID=35570 RepID=UPI0027E27343|nr:fibrous sheath CABYR-binding protein-like [Stomoxys calcitrans]